MRRQRGSVLLLTLVFMALTLLISVNLLENSLFSYRLLIQQQQKADALLQVENTLARLLQQNHAWLMQDKTYPYRSCGAAVQDLLCDDKKLQLDDEAMLPGLFYYADYRLAATDNKRRWHIVIVSEAPLYIRLQAGIEFQSGNGDQPAQINDEGEWYFF